MSLLAEPAASQSLTLSQAVKQEEATVPKLKSAKKLAWHNDRTHTGGFRDNFLADQEALFNKVWGDEVGGVRNCDRVYRTSCIIPSARYGSLIDYLGHNHPDLHWIGVTNGVQILVLIEDEVSSPSFPFFPTDAQEAINWIATFSAPCERPEGQKRLQRYRHKYIPTGEGTLSSDEEPEAEDDGLTAEVDDWVTEEPKYRIGAQRRELLAAVYQAAGARLTINTLKHWQYEFLKGDEKYWEITSKHRPFFEYTKAKRLEIGEEWKQLREEEFEDSFERIGKLVERLRHIRALEDILIKKLLYPLSDWDTEPMDDDWDKVPMASVAWSTRGAPEYRNKLFLMAYGDDL